jgi:hypothetical protein
MGHSHKGDEMPCMETVCSGIETYVEGNLLLVKNLAQFLLIGALGNEATLFQCVKYVSQ